MRNYGTNLGCTYSTSDGLPIFFPFSSLHRTRAMPPRRSQSTAAIAHRTRSKLAIATAAARPPSPSANVARRLQFDAMSPHCPAAADDQSSSPHPSSAGDQPPSSPSVVGQPQLSPSALRTDAPVCRDSVEDSSAKNNSSQHQPQPKLTVRLPQSAGKGPLRPPSTQQISTSESSEYSPLQPLQTLSDNAFSHLFYCAALSSFQRSLSVKSFICQKRIVISDFSAKMGLIGKLKPCQMFTSVVTIDQFVKPVVYEFYANLAPELVCHNRVYIRGQLFDFGPDSINHYFWSADYDDEFVEDMDQITAKLIGGAKTRWVAKDTIKAVDLTASFALLHKIACTNWMPTKHHSYVKRSMVVLLYKIDQGVKFNLGKLLFQQILDARNGANNKKELILPNLICDPRLLHGTHVDNLGAPEDSHHQTRSSSDGAIVETIHILEEELVDIHDEQKRLACRRVKIDNILKRLRREDAVNVDIPFEVASSSASSSNDDSPASPSR
nr:uncharacterized protein LOC109169177 [Ipomoea batatas]